jgi:hypothetical protein
VAVVTVAVQVQGLEEMEIQELWQWGEILEGQVCTVLEEPLQEVQVEVLMTLTLEAILQEQVALAVLVKV